MGKMEFYEVDGHQHFIPVKVIGDDADKTFITVEIVESGYVDLVQKVYCFPKEKTPQKVLVPKFVADWFSKNPIQGWWRKIAQWENAIPTEDRDVYSWYSNYNETNFIQAWIAYPNIEVEQEQLYTVEIPNPNDEHLMTVLKRLSSGKVIMCTVHRSNIHFFENKEFQLTESEI
ncbi:DUF1642 domain-containing protein, partial [Streptococcus suis]